MKSARNRGRARKKARFSPREQCAPVAEVSLCVCVCVCAHVYVCIYVYVYCTGSGDCRRPATGIERGEEEEVVVMVVEKESPQDDKDDREDAEGRGKTLVLGFPSSRATKRGEESERGPRCRAARRADRRGM